MVVQQFVRAKNKENVKVKYYWAIRRASALFKLKKESTKVLHYPAFVRRKHR